MKQRGRARKLTVCSTTIGTSCPRVTGLRSSAAALSPDVEAAHKEASPAPAVNPPNVGERCAEEEVVENGRPCCCCCGWCSGSKRMCRVMSGRPPGVGDGEDVYHVVVGCGCCSGCCRCRSFRMGIDTGVCCDGKRIVRSRTVRPSSRNVVVVVACCPSSSHCRPNSRSCTFCAHAFVIIGCVGGRRI